MKLRAAAMAVWSLAAPAAACAPGTVPASTPVQREATLKQHASGTFEVRVTPQTADDAEGTPIARMSLDKRFDGDLDATSTGEMLTAVTPVDGSAAYVALERVQGTLRGRAGTFVLQHRGVMERGAQTLSVDVVRDSGTGQLLGITGSMTIRVEDGEHFYELDYALPISD